MAPVVLQTDVHCFDCARKIRNTINSLLGVERVWASPDAGLVVVAGTADAWVLRRRIQHRTRRRVTIVSDGTQDRQLDRHYYGMVHLAPPQYAPPPYYSWGTTTSYPHHYAPQPVGYTYGGDHWASWYPRRYASNGTPTYLDDQIPDACCSIQTSSDFATS